MIPASLSSNNMSQAVRPRSRKFSEEEWERHREVITSAYQSGTLEDVVRILSGAPHYFPATWVLLADVISVTLLTPPQAVPISPQAARMGPFQVYIECSLAVHWPRAQATARSSQRVRSDDQWLENSTEEGPKGDFPLCFASGGATKRHSTKECSHSDAATGFFVGCRCIQRGRDP